MPRRLDLSGHKAPPTVDSIRPFEIAVGPTLVAPLFASIRGSTGLELVVAERVWG
jgi:hypothetical protein